MPTELERVVRDRRLRRKILSILQDAQVSPTGGLGGETILCLVEGSGEPDFFFDDEDHAIRLCRSLVAKGLIEEKSLTRRRREVFGMRHLFFKITASGISLLNETAKVDPDVWDERIPSEGESQ